jgi:hypothetical protein
MRLDENAHIGGARPQQQRNDQVNKEVEVNQRGGGTDDEETEIPMKMS